MRQLFFLNALVILSPAIWGQTILYQEDFSGQNNLGAIGHSSGQPILNSGSATWSLDLSQANLSASDDWFQVQSETFEGRDLDGEAQWLSPLISISAYPAVGFSIQVEEIGNHESSDYLITEFRIDGQNWLQANSNGNLNDDFGALEVSHFGISGSTLEIRIRAQNNAASEYLQFDDILVEGFQELLYQNGTWNRIPDLFSDSLNLRVASGEVLSLSASADIRNLIIEANASLNIASNQALTIHEGIQNDGSLAISTAASLIQTAITDLNTGTGISRYTQSYSAVDHQRFSFWSSPIQAADINTVFATTNVNDRYCFDPLSQSFILCSTGAMTVGQAYAFTPSVQSSIQVQNFSDQRIFEGNLNNGDVVLNFSGLQAGDWLLLGNPYPSPIDFQSFIAENLDLLGTLYLWDASTPLSTGAAYANWNSAGANPVPFSSRANPNSHIAVCQGFMVQLSPTFNASNLSISFKNEMRVFNTAPVFFKNDEEKRQFWFSIKSDGIGAGTMINLHNSSSINFEFSQDANLKPTASGLNIYSILDHRELSIQSLPWRDGLVQAIGVEIPDAGIYSIQLDSSKGLSNTWVYLLDKELGNIICLNDSNAQIQFSTSQKLNERFELHFYDRAMLSSELPDMTVSPYNYQIMDGFILISASPAAQPLLEYRLFSLNGLEVASAQFSSSDNQYRIDARHMPEGMYLLSHKDLRGQWYSTKVFLKN